MKKIAHRIDKWEYTGGDIGNIWVDTNGKTYHHITNIMEYNSKIKKINKFSIDWEKGEIFTDEKE